MVNLKVFKDRISKYCSILPSEMLLDQLSSGMAFLNIFFWLVH